MPERPDATPRPRPRPSVSGSSRPPATGVPPPSGGPRRVGNLPVTAIAVVAIAVAVLVWLLFIRGDDDSGSGGSLGGPAAEKSVEVVPASQLGGTVAETGYPVYWVGPSPSVDYEVTLITDGRTYIRYLPTSEQAGTETPYLTVGSYSQPNALKVLQRLGENSGSQTINVGGGGLALKQADRPTGVYVAFPGEDTQIEVYDSQPGRALELVRSGAVVPVG